MEPLADENSSDDGEDAGGKRCSKARRGCTLIVSSTVANNGHDNAFKKKFRSASFASLHSVRNRTALALVFTGRFFLLRKLVCFSRVLVVNTLAWKNRVELAAPHFLVCVPSHNCEFCFFFLRQFRRLHSDSGQMTSAAAINAVPVLEEVCAGTTGSTACGST